MLAGHGIKRGDPVLLVLPRITLWQAAYIGALRLGAIVIPCTSMLREKDLVYRANHSGARAVIASVENATMIADLRKECPSVEHYLIAGAARTGWISLQEYMGHSSAAFKPANTKSSEPAICYYTSGTTREPKAVLHSHSYTYSHKFTGLNWLDLQARRYPLDDLGHRMGQGGVRRAVRAVDERRDDVHVQRPLRRAQRTRVARPLRHHYFLRAADRVSNDHQGRPLRATNSRNCGIAPAPASR